MPKMLSSSRGGGKTLGEAAIPEDLREHYEECGKYQSKHLILCRQLIERIARLEAENERLRAIESAIHIRLNNHLGEMKPEQDDSIVGFNEAWDIVRSAFKETKLLNSNTNI